MNHLAPRESSDRALPLAFTLACAIAAGAVLAWSAQALLPEAAQPALTALAAVALALLAGAAAVCTAMPCRRARWLLGAACALGVALGWNTPARRAHSTARTEGPVALHGTVASAPRLDGAGADRLSPFAHQSASMVFELDVDAAEDAGRLVPMNTAVLVRVQEIGDLPPRGSAVRVRGWYRSAKPPANPGARGGRGGGSVVVPRRSLITPAPTGLAALDALGEALRRARTAADQALGASLPVWAPPPARALVVAMTTGVRKPGLEQPAADFRAAGMSHVLAISGFNVAVLVAFAAGLMRSLGASTRVRSIAAVGVALLFLAATEPEVSVLRAGLGAGLAALASFRGGRARGLGTLGVVAGFTMLLDIESLASPGFQLSYGVVVALLVLAGPAAARWEPRAEAAWNALLRASWARGEAATLVRAGLTEAFISGMVAWTISTPIALWHGGFASLYSAPLSVLTMPLAAIVTVAGVGAMVLAPLCAWVACGFGAASAGCAQALAWMAHIAARLPGSCWWTGRPAIWWVVVSVVLASIAWRSRSPLHRRLAWCALVPLAALLWTGVALPLGGVPSAGVLRMETLDVGNGSCHLLRTSDAAILFDAGSASDDCAGSRRVVPSLAALGIRTLDALVISHSNLDHFSAIPEVLRAFRVRMVVVAAPLAGRMLGAREGALAELRRALMESGVPIVSLSIGDELRVGSICARALHPSPLTPAVKSNDECLVLRVRHRDAVAPDATILLCGDIEDPGCAALMASGGAQPAAAMELPHHGSWRAGAAALVAAVAPQVVVQSTGAQRVQQDRWAQALAQTRRGVTAFDGALRCEVTPEGRASLWNLREGVWVERSSPSRPVLFRPAE